MIRPNGVARFSCRRQRSSKAESWGVDLPNLVREWPTLCCDNVLQPTWNISTFLQSSTGASHASAFVSASHVSARNLQAPCPPSLAKALPEDFVDRSTWGESYREEKDGLIENDTYVEIPLQE